MSEAIRFLHALAQALATVALYTPGHPAARRAVENAWQAIQALLAVNAGPAFLFLGSAPVYGDRALHEMSDWPWSRRLADALVQRIEFDRALTRESFLEWIDHLQVLTAAGATVESETQLPGVTYGPVGVERLVFDDAAAAAPPSPEEEATVLVNLSDELDATRFVLREAGQGRIARAEGEAVIRLLGELTERHALAQSDVADASEPAAHALNTALLVMAAGLGAGLDAADRHRLGVVALWHDVGMTQLPRELASKATLTPDERAVVERHTILGAQLLLRSGGAGLEFAALVAFEHHLRPDGTGYPVRRFRTAPHWVSGLVGVAAAYTAIRAPRPYREAWGATRALGFLEAGMGSVFDAEAARLIVKVVAI